MWQSIVRTCIMGRGITSLFTSAGKGSQQNRPAVLFGCPLVGPPSLVETNGVDVRAGAIASAHDEVAICHLKAGWQTQSLQVAQAPLRGHGALVFVLRLALSQASRQGGTIRQAEGLLGGHKAGPGGQACGVQATHLDKIFRGGWHKGWRGRGRGRRAALLAALLKDLRHMQEANGFCGARG